MYVWQYFIIWLIISRKSSVGSQSNCIDLYIIDMYILIRLHLYKVLFDLDLCCFGIRPDDLSGFMLIIILQ